MPHTEKPRIGILASGGGSTAEAFVHATQNGTVEADVDFVVCNNPSQKAGVYGRIGQLNDRYGLHIETFHISSLTHPEGAAERGMTDEESEAIRSLASERDIALIGLMGYMKIVRGPLLDAYGWHEGMSPVEARMVNTHPGPLPETADTHGVHTSQRVLDLGMTMSRHTVHLVSAGVDKGPIILETPVEIGPSDSADDLFQRVQRVEKAALPIAIAKFLSDKTH